MTNASSQVAPHPFLADSLPKTLRLSERQHLKLIRHAEPG